MACNGSTTGDVTNIIDFSKAVAKLKSKGK